MGYIAAELTKGWMMEGVGEQVIFRIILSLALAAVIGCERSSKRHSAGMRSSPNPKSVLLLFYNKCKRRRAKNQVFHYL